MGDRTHLLFVTFNIDIISKTKFKLVFFPTHVHFIFLFLHHHCKYDIHASISVHLDFFGRSSLVNVLISLLSFFFALLAFYLLLMYRCVSASLGLLWQWTKNHQWALQRHTHHLLQLKCSPHLWCQQVSTFISSHANSLLSVSLIHVCLFTFQVLGVCEEEPQRKTLEGPLIKRPVSAEFVSPRYPLRLPERGLHVCPLRHWVQNLEGAARHRWRHNPAVVVS